MLYIFCLNTLQRIKIFECLICKKFSFEIICKSCQKEFLKPDIEFKNDILSFYKYEEISFLLKYKYHKFGNFIYKILAKNSLKLFAKEFKEKAYLIAIDDKIEKGYSHSAVLVNSMKTKFLTPYYSVLHSKNSFKYAGKSLEERIKNPRMFEYRGKKGIDVILVDDILTTGLTLNEAKDILKKNSVNVLFSIVLARP